jgi:uncharacterized protein (DUF2062 family)
MTPTMGIHMASAVLAAFFLRVNIPIAVAACWVVNPVNAPLVYYLEYKVGVWLVGIAEPQQFQGYLGMLKDYLRVVRPLLVGTLVMGVPPAVLTYFSVYFGWDAVERMLAGRKAALTEVDDA